MKVIINGNSYKIYDDSLKVCDHLPSRTYSVRFSPMSGFCLEAHADLIITEKVYGVHDEKVKKVLNSFDKFERSLGVILSGDKGIGKSLFAKRLCEKAVSTGIPVLIVDQPYPGIADYIESIEQPVVVLFDEFDKTFSGKDDDGVQAGLLSLFDGTSCGKKLFVLTCNSLYSLNNYLINRPGRFHYHFRFDYPNGEEIRQYLTDKLDEEYRDQIDSVVAFAGRVDLNYDCLRAIAFELNTGLSFSKAITDLNIINNENQYYEVTLRFENGAILKKKRCSLDLFDQEAVHDVSLYDAREDNICDVRFVIQDTEYNPMTGATVIPGDKLSFTYWDDECEPGKTLKKVKPVRLDIARQQYRGLHYTV